jgi:hypothetical protein
MPKDVIVNVSVEQVVTPINDISVLILSTEGVMPLTTYTSLADVASDYSTTVSDTVVYKKAYNKAAALLTQRNPNADGSLQSVMIVGINTPVSVDNTDPENQVTTVDTAAITAALESVRAQNDDWYVLLTDLDDDESITAIAGWVEQTGTAESVTSEKQKVYFCKTANQNFPVRAYSRTVFICVDSDSLDTENPDAAWVGYCASEYPTAINWKFRSPSGVTPTTKSASERDALETAHLNFFTTENKRNYFKNGVMGDGTFIDLVLGADYIDFEMTRAWYDVLLNNDQVPYTDDGITLVVGAIESSLQTAASYGIVATDPETNLPVYDIDVPSVSDFTAAQIASRQLPPIKWNALQQGAINGGRTNGILRVQL